MLGLLWISEHWFMDGSPKYAERLRVARERSGLTTAKAAEIVGVPEIVWQAYEVDLAEPARDDAPRIASMLGVSMIWLGYDPELIRKGRGTRRSPARDSKSGSPQPPNRPTPTRQPCPAPAQS